MAENLMVMLRNLEACTGNDALMSESDVRRTSRTHPIFIGGSDFICSGFGSIQRYDNMFGPSQWNAEDIDDFLAMQRDWGVDGGLRPRATARRTARWRRCVGSRAADGRCRDVYRRPRRSPTGSRVAVERPSSRRLQGRAGRRPWPSSTASRVIPTPA